MPVLLTGGTTASWLVCLPVQVLSPGWGHCVAFLGTSKCNAGVNPAMDLHPNEGGGGGV